MCVCSVTAGETSCLTLIKRDQKQSVQPGPHSTQSRFPAPQALGSSDTHMRRWNLGAGLECCAGCRDGEAPWESLTLVQWVCNWGSSWGKNAGLSPFLPEPKAWPKVGIEG